MRRLICRLFGHRHDELVMKGSDINTGEPTWFESTCQRCGRSFTWHSRGPVWRIKDPDPRHLTDHEQSLLEQILSGRHPLTPRNFNKHS